METELKLLIHPEHAAVLLRHPLLLKHAGPSRVLQMQDTYFDTPDFDLWRNKAGLRVRSIGDVRVQTLKGGGGVKGGLHQRHEWECSIAGDEPELEALLAQMDGHKSWRALLTDPAISQNMRPLFNTHIERTVWDIRLQDGAEIELVLDQGQLTAAGSTERISEIELELKAGSAQQLYELAIQLQKKIPLRIATRSKAERGYDLAIGRKHSGQKAEDLNLRASMSLVQAFQLLVEHCLAQMLSNEAVVLQGDDVEGLHQLRVGLRKLRCATRLFRKVTPLPLQVREDLAWMSEQLGPARDWDVLIESGLKKIMHTHSSTELSALIELASTMSDEAHASVRAALNSDRYGRLMLALSAMAHGMTLPETIASTSDKRKSKSAAQLQEFSHRKIVRLYRKLIQAGAKLAEEDAAGRHHLRILAKKLRYRIEFFSSLYPKKRAQAFLQALSVLQDTLGALNDAVTAGDFLQKIGAQSKDLEVCAAFVQGYLLSTADRTAAQVQPVWKALTELDMAGF